VKKAVNEKFSLGILFILKGPLSSFIKNDLELLNKHFMVYLLRINLNPFKFLCSFIKSIRNTDIVFVWFAGFQAFISVFISKIFRKKLVVVAGGYDVAYVPEINYGAFTSRWRGLMAIFVFRNADLVLTVSKYTMKEFLSRISPKKAYTVYNCVDTTKFSPAGKKEKIVLTVGAVNQSNLKKKGLEIFVKTAKLLPEVRFVLVGRHTDHSIKILKEIASKNVEFTGFVSFNKLLELYRRAMVYTQLSYHESFGVALAEAMACGCVPVVTEKAALPEVAGECGIYVPYDDIEATAEAIRDAFKREDLGRCARNRVERMFSLEKREKELVKHLTNLFDK